MERRTLENDPMYKELINIKRFNELKIGQHINYKIIGETGDFNGTIKEKFGETLEILLTNNFTGDKKLKINEITNITEFIDEPIIFNNKTTNNDTRKRVSDGKSNRKLYSNKRKKSVRKSNKRKKSVRKV